jgi:hypothetical protein
MEKNMTAYTKMKLRLERHVFKRGANKGAAPAAQRWKDHLLILDVGDSMALRMYNTDILRVFPNGNVRINLMGWEGSTTTRANLNRALHTYCGWGGVFSRKVFGMSQVCFSTQGKTYRYYDGMEFNAAGELLSPAQVFSRRRTDRDATKQFRQDIKTSGFQEMFPVLYSSLEGAPGYFRVSQGIIATDEQYSEHWPDLIANIKYRLRPSDHKDAFKTFVSSCTRNMLTVENTDVTVL